MITTLFLLTAHACLVACFPAGLGAELTRVQALLVAAHPVKMLQAPAPQLVSVCV
jgi:hypothetical protein